MFKFTTQRILHKRQQIKSTPRFYLWLLLFAAKELTIGVLSWVCILLNKRDILRIILAKDDKWVNGFLLEKLQDNSKTYLTEQPNLVAPVYDITSHVLACHGGFEQHVQGCLSNQVFPKLDARGIALDLGANIGIHTCFFSRHFAKTYAFELNPRTAKILELNMELHAANKVNIVPKGASNRNGSATAYVVKHSSLVDSLSSSESYRNNPDYTAISGNVVEQEFTLCRLDDTIPKDEHGKIAFIKIDVEGHEIQALQGMPEILKFKPTIGFEALESSFDQHANQPIIEHLMSCGYSHFYEVNRKSVSLVQHDKFPVKTYDMIIATCKQLL